METAPLPESPGRSTWSCVGCGAPSPTAGRPAGGARWVPLACSILLAALVTPVTAPASAAAVTLTITLRGTVPGGTVGVFPLELVCSRSPLPGTCAFSIESGVSLVLVANSLPPNSPAGVFSGGTGSAAGCAGSSTCSFTITTDSAITATFDPALGPFATVTVALEGTGRGSVRVGNFPCQNDDPLDVSFCSSRYAPGSVVTLFDAEAAPGSIFAGISGACVSSVPACSFRIAADGAVRVAFNQPVVPGGAGTVETVSGTVTLKTPLESGPLTAASAPAPGSLLQTGGDGAATVGLPNGRRVSIEANTLVTVVHASTSEIVLGQFAGTLTHAATPGAPSQGYRVQTPVATVRATGTEFATRYIEAGGFGELLVTVQQGTVEVQDRRGQITALSAQAQARISEAVPRPSLLLPVGRAPILEGRLQTFGWTAFPGATGYLLEYTLEASGFAEPNPPAPQSARNTLRLLAGGFREAGGTVEFPILVPPGVVPSGTPVRWRVFPADGSGQPLPGSTASDASSFDVLPGRAAPVLPADGDVVIGGGMATFGWTGYPGAAAYLFEFTLNPAGFGVPNAAAAESLRNTLRVSSGAFTESGGAVTFPLFVPAGVAPAGTRAQWRVFPLDATGGVLTNTTASDARGVILQ